MARIDLDALRSEILAEIEEFNLLADMRGVDPIIVGSSGVKPSAAIAHGHELFDLSGICDTWWKHQTRAEATLESLGFTETDTRGIWKRDSDTEIAVMQLSTGYETVSDGGKVMDAEGGSARFAHHLTIVSQARK